MKIVSRIPVTLCLCLIVSGAFASEQDTAEQVATQLAQNAADVATAKDIINALDTRLLPPITDFIIGHLDPGEIHIDFEKLLEQSHTKKVEKVNPTAAKNNIIIGAVFKTNDGYVSKKVLTLDNVIDNDDSITRPAITFSISSSPSPQVITMGTFFRPLATPNRYMRITPETAAADRKAVTQFKVNIDNAEAALYNADPVRFKKEQRILRIPDSFVPQEPKA